jgi:hypothetical protein
MEIPDYPDNSHKNKEKNIKRVTTSDPLRKKKSFRKQFSETFIAGNVDSTARYVVMGVLLPAARDMIFDVVSEGAHRLIFGDKARRRGGSTTPYSGPTGHVAYNRYSRDDRPPLPKTMSPRGRARHDFDEIVLDNRVEAEEVIDQMFEVVSRHGEVTVADLYELVGLASTHTDYKWGWEDLRGAGVTRIRNGYLLDLPDPEPLD